MRNKKSKSGKKKRNSSQDNAGEDVDLSDDGSDVDSDVSMSSDSSSNSSTMKGGNQTTEPKPSTSRVIDDTDSSSGDESCEKCAICLRLIKSQEVGSPEGCDHVFCAVCIIEWSKNSNVCPLDRQPFTIILVRKNKEGKVVRQVPVEEPRPIQNFELEDDTFCEICGGSDREDRILLCDGCDRGFHTYCLTPPLEEIPAEDEWFCPDCFSDTNVPLAEEVHMYASELDDLLNDAEAAPATPRSLRPRNSSGRARVASRVRTRLFERIRQTVLYQMIRSHRLLREMIEESSSDYFNTSEDEMSSGSSVDTVAETESMTSESQPGPSGVQKKTPTKAKPKTKRKTTRRTTTRKRKTATKKGKTTKRKATTKRKTRKTGTKRKTAKRKKTTSTKKIKIENEDGTITEKVVKTKKTVRRKRRATRKRRTKKTTRGRTKTSRRLLATAKPKTVKGRLALTLGMVPPKKPGQLLPDVKIKPKEPRLAGIDLNRARAGIPTLHIFEPRDELQYYSSGSDNEDFEGGDGGGGVATATRIRTHHTRILDRKEAAKMYRSSTATAKTKSVVVEQTNDNVDILGSILESQTIWHSKETDVKINFDGSIEYVRDRRPGGDNNENNNRPIDVREGNSDEKTTKTPMYPGSGSNSGSGNFQYNRSNYGGQRGGQDNSSFSPGSNVNFGRFGAPRNDREGYANYLNNMGQGPAPFCRGGPPLRFRMPARPQLRRIQFAPRNRTNWPQEEEVEGEGEDEEEEEVEEGGGGEIHENEEKKEEDDVDLYSDIENPSEKDDGNGNDGGNTSYPAIAPPPEPSAFLLGIDENGDVPQEKDKSEVYDPAEPCDSDEEMVIDEKEQPEEPKKEEEKEKEKEEEESRISNNSTPAPSPSPSPSPERIKSPRERPRTSTEDDDEDCPIFSIYSSVSREFSEKEEEVREREIAEEKRKVEELKSKDEPKIEEGARLSFDFEDKVEEKSPTPEEEKSPKRSSSSESERSRKSPPPKTESDASDGEKEKKEEESVAPKIATGLEGLDVEEVSSENGDGDEFADKRSLSSLSLSDLSNRRSRSPVQSKKKKKKKRKTGKKKNFEEGEIDDSDKRKSDADGKNENEDNENKERKRRRSRSQASDRQVLSSKENKKQTKDPKNKDKDLSWKKPSKKDKNYREGKRRSKERRSRTRSRDRRKSRSPSAKKDKKKSKDRKKKSDKKKEIERYDVRKIVKNKEVRKTDAFGRDIVSKSRSKSPSRSRSPIRDRTRNMLRRDSRTFSRSRSRSFRRGRSPVRRRFRSRSRSKSVRRSFSRSRSRSPRKTKKKIKAKDRLKNRSRSRRKSRSPSRTRRRSLSRTRSRSPVPRVVRNKKIPRARRSWSHHISRSPSFSPRRSRTVSRSPIRIRRSYSRSLSTSWSRGRSPLPRASSLEKLTVVLTTKDKKKSKKKKEGKNKDKEERRKKKTGNSKEVFASGDNVLVSVNFRNNTTNNSSNIQDERLGSLSPVVPAKKKRDDFSKKKKSSSAVSKNAVDAALSNVCQKRAKKLTRLSEKDAEVILNRKPVAVIDLDMSPYREQTPSPVNVVVVSDSGSGDEGKEQTPQRQRQQQSPGSEIEKSQENVPNQDNISAPSSPVTNGYLTSSGPKTPPEPQIKFSITKPQQLRQIANPLGDDDDEDDAEEEEEERTESLDRRIEKELEGSHKGPNTPPEPRGPTTPPSSQTSPDAYDPFEPTKSRSPSPTQDKENRQSPKADQKDEQTATTAENLPAEKTAEESDKIPEIILDSDDKNPPEAADKGDVIPVLDSSNAPVQTNAPVAEIPDSPERKISVVITTPQSKTQPQIQKPYAPILKTLPMAPTTTSSNASSLTVAPPVFSLPSPTKTSRATTTTTQTLQVTGIQRLQHRLGSPVNRTPNSIKSTPEKRLTPRTNEITESYVRSVSKRNGEQPKQPRPLQDATNETIDMTIDMDDSPYSPASSEGDDLFEPPVETSKPTQKPAQAYKPPPVKAQHKSPMKPLSKFDLLFGPSGPQVSPVKTSNKKTKAAGKNLTTPAKAPAKTTKKNAAAASKKNISMKMDEDQLRILDELPSSAVELQVKDKFLKKLNRQERVVDEVKTVLKPHYARKHITKEEYKDILRRAVPKICHSRSGEINPSKIQSLIEAYVRKFRHAKKKGSNTVTKPKKKSMFS